ncbi:MAG: LPXTG cell wall anchor domain-containing protein [Clostridiales bacterium]|nr:LPXTG cell wall anchor domain-containing protein [Clostridiales bacterium]
MGKRGMWEKLKRLMAAMLCVIILAGNGLSSLAELGPLNMWIPVASDSNASVASEEETSSGSAVVVAATGSNATASNATASNATSWQKLLQARIDALPSIEEIQADETNELLVDTYWEVLDIMDVLDEQAGVALYASIMDEDDGSIEGAEELDVTRLYEIADYVMVAYALLGASQQMGSLTFVTDQVIMVEPYQFAGANQVTLTLEVTGDYDIASADSNHEEDYYSYYTGETLTLDFGIDGGMRGEYDYRIYFQPSDPSGLYDGIPNTGIYADYEGIAKQRGFYGLADYALPEGDLTDGEEYGSMEAGDYTAPLKWDADEEAFYLDFADVPQDATVAGTLQVTYPSETTPGGDLIIYGVVYENEIIVSADTEAFDASWKTQSETFQVELSLDATQEEKGLMLQADGSGSTHVAVTDNPDQDIIYTITMENTTEESVTADNIGEDLILYIGVTQTITLPAGIKVDSTEFIAQENSSGNVEFFADGASGDAILTLVNNSGIQSSGYSLGYDATANTLTLTWTFENSSADDSGFPEEQIEGGIWEVCLNGDYLLLDDEDAFNAETTHEIISTVTYDYYYTWSGKLDNDDTEKLPIAEPSSNVLLTKTADRSGEEVIMGEDAYYTITLYNQGVNTTTDLSQLADDQLSAEQYITPANIWKMFFGDESDTTENLATDSGEYLTIVVTGAMVYYNTPLDLDDLEVLSDMDGNANVYKSVANYNSNGEIPTYTDAAITMIRNGTDSISVTFIDGNSLIYSTTVKSADELEKLFLRIGYVVTASATYSVYWDLTDHQLSGGETRNYKVYSTIKGTFQYWRGTYLNHAVSINEATNTVHLYYDNTGKTETDEDYKNSDEAKANYTSIPYDFLVRKIISEVDGDKNADTSVLYRGSIVTYELTMDHDGNSVVEDLPMIDEVTGSQILLIPVTPENVASCEENNWPIDLQGASNYYVTYNEQEYYPLSLGGTYVNVWLDSQHCAASVVVDETNYVEEEGGYIDYTITWNYDTIEGSRKDTLTYCMQVMSQDYVTSAENTVYLNGRYSKTDSGVIHISTLYDKIDAIDIRSGSLKKRILTSDWGVDAEDETYEYSSVLDLEENTTTVYYKLELDAKSGNGTLIFEDVKDVLPYTYGIFDWDATNIEVIKCCYANPESEDDKPVLEYELYYSDEEGNYWDKEDYISQYGKAPYQTIYFNNVELLENRQAIWIYIKLEFPTDATEWALYAAKVSGYLENTLSAVVEDAEEAASVIHSVKKDAKAYLQKGVYWITTSTESTSLAADSKSREVYYNSSAADAEDGSLVAYYIQLYNASSSYLYLEKIQDVVPDGFELVALYSGTSSYEAGTGVTSTGSVETATNSPASCLKDENGNEISGVTWVSAHVEADTNEDGFLYFEVTSPNVDETIGYSYLEEGEAISFIAEFRVGTESETEDYAVNKIAMPYITLSGSDLSVAEDVAGEAEEMTGTSSLAQNVGGCSILSETDEREYEGFQTVTPSVGEVSQWLFSEVTVNRGEIIPGIHKTLATTESGGLDGNVKVEWDIEVTNDGTIDMKNYTIRDNVDSPYLIRGDIYYEIVQINDDGSETSLLAPKSDTSSTITSSRYNSAETLPLFSVTRNSNNTFSLAWKRFERGSIKDGSSDGVLGDSVSIDPLLFVYDTNYKRYRRAQDYTVTVTIDQDEDGNDYVSIDFSGDDLKIPAGGKGIMSVDTKTLDTITASRGTYYNLATLTPVQSYDEKLVTIGETVSASESTSGAAYIKSSDQVHVSNGYSTNAQQWIQSMDDSSKYARSETESGVNYINLTGTDESFTYTLEVTNNLTNPMTNLVIVDTLPETDDYAPFTVSDRTQRYSEFQVDLLTEGTGIGWKVIKGTKSDDTDSEGKDLPASATIASTTEVPLGTGGTNEYYTVHYSTSTDLGLGLTDNDSWELTGSVDWTDDPTGARAVRIEICNADIEPKQAVQVSFNAIISSDSTDIAEPGEFGWNSFAYQYTTAKVASATHGEDDGEAKGSTAATTTLWAAPRKVGVCIPDVPWLTKTLVGVDTTDTSLGDQTFRFLVHAGEQLTSFDYADNSDGKLEENLTSALETAGLAYIIKELTGDVSKGVSESIQLDDSTGKLTYTDGASYTVVELPCGDSNIDPGNDLFVLSSLSVGSTYTTKNVITFTYSQSSVVEVTAANKRIDWWISILKQDADTQEALSGVVFGLYSKTDPDYEEGYLDDTYGNLISTPSDAAEITIEGESGTWYLVGMKVTDADGRVRWEDLTDSVYYLKELKVPDGYYLPADPIRVDYWNVADGDYYTQAESSTSTGSRIVTVTVNNKIGYTLPKTGGRGTLWIQLTGLMLMSMCVSFTYTSKRRSTKLRRKK